MLRFENTIMFTIATWITLVLLLAVALASAGSDPTSHARFCSVNEFYSCFADHGPHLLRTSLHVASFSRQQEVVGLLLAVRADKAAKESLRPMPFPIPGFIGNYLF